MRDVETAACIRSIIGFTIACQESKLIIDNKTLIRAHLNRPNCLLWRQCLDNTRNTLNDFTLLLRLNILVLTLEGIDVKISTHAHVSDFTVKL